MPNPVLEKYGITEETRGGNPILDKYKVSANNSTFFDKYLTQSALSQIIGSKVTGEVFAGGARVPRTITGVTKGLMNNLLESKWDSSKVVGKDMMLDPKQQQQARANILKSFQIPGGMFAPAGSEKINQVKQDFYDMQDELIGNKRSKSVVWEFVKTLPFTTGALGLEIGANPAIFLTFKGIGSLMKAGMKVPRFRAFMQKERSLFGEAMPREMQDAYRTMGFDPKSKPSFGDVRARYHNLTLKYDPDRVAPHLKNVAQEKFKNISTAYKTLEKVYGQSFTKLQTFIKEFNKSPKLLSERGEALVPFEFKRGDIVKYGKDTAEVLLTKGLETVVKIGGKEQTVRTSELKPKGEGIPKGLQPLTEEAKKYKSAKEFIEDTSKYKKDKWVGWSHVISDKTREVLKDNILKQLSEEVGVDVSYLKTAKVDEETLKALDKAGITKEELTKKLKETQDKYLTNIWKQAKGKKVEPEPVAPKGEGEILGKSYAELKQISGSDEVTVYRASVKGGEIKDGDWVTTDKEIAKFYARDIVGQRGAKEAKIVSKKVKAGDIRLKKSQQDIGVENQFQLSQPKGEVAKEPEALPEERADFERFMKEYEESELSLEQAVKQLGGIKSYRAGKEAEELQGVPLNLRNNQGLTADEMVSGLKNLGFHFEDANELVATLSEKKPTVSYKKFTPETREYLKQARISKVNKKEALKLYRRVARELAKPLPTSKVKAQVRAITGQYKVETMVKESQALKAGLKKAEKASIEAFRMARREGISVQKAHERMIEIRSEARREVTKLINDIKKVDTSVMRPEYAKQIKDLIGDLQFTQPSKRTLIKFSAIRQELEANPELELSDETMARLREVENKSMRDLSVDDLRALHDEIIHKAKLDSLKRKLTVRKKEREFFKTRDEIIGELKPLPEVKEAIVSLADPKFKKIKDTGKLLVETFGIRSEHLDLIIETLAGADSQTFDVLFQQIEDGLKNKLAYIQNIYDTFGEKLLPILEESKIKDLVKWAEEKVTVGNIEMTRGQRSALYAHTLNENNLRHVLEGGIVSQINPLKVIPISEEYLDTFKTSLTPAEKQIANAMIEILEQTGNDITPVFLKKTGLEFPKELNYYPIDVARVGLPELVEEKDILDELRGKFVRVGIRKGHLNKRTKSKLPIKLSNIFQDFNKSITNTANYVNLEIPMSNASRLLYDKAFKTEIQRRYGEVVWKEIEKGYRDIIANDNWQNYTSVEKIIMKTKNRLSTAILGLNPFVMAKQPLSYALYSVYVNPKYMTQAFIDYSIPSKGREIIERHKKYSPTFRERLEKGYSRDVADIFKEGIDKRLLPGKKPLREQVMKGIMMFDASTVARGMQGCVLQRLDELKGSELSPEERLKEAYRFADDITSKTQPMFNPEYRSPISRGTVIEKVATPFTTQVNQNLNLIRRLYRQARRTNAKEDWDRFAYATFLITVIIPIGLMGIDKTRDFVYKRKLNITAKDFFLAQIKAVGSMFYFARDIVSSIISKTERGTWLGYDYSNPVLSSLNKFSDTAAQGIRIFTADTPKKRKKALLKYIDNTLDLAFLTFGLPYQTPKKLITKPFETEESKGLKSNPILEKYGINKRKLGKNPILEKYGL